MRHCVATFAGIVSVPVALWRMIQTRIDPETAEVAELTRQLRAVMPTIDAGREWFASVRDDHSFIDRYREQILAASPVLTHGACRPWTELIEDNAWGDRLSSPVAMRLLAALLVWQLAATVRAFKRQGVAIDALKAELFTAMIEDAERWPREQGLENVLPRFPHRVEQVQSLYEEALQAPDPDPRTDAPELIGKTLQVVEIDHIADARETLASQWRVMDVATLAVIYRSFGEQFQRVG